MQHKQHFGIVFVSSKGKKKMRFFSLSFDEENDDEQNGIDNFITDSIFYTFANCFKRPINNMCNLWDFSSNHIFQMIKSDTLLMLLLCFGLLWFVFVQRIQYCMIIIYLSDFFLQCKQTKVAFTQKIEKEKKLKISKLICDSLVE